MRFVEIAGANLTLAENQDEYETIRVRKGKSHIQVGSLLIPMPSMTLELKPTPEELEQLNAGGSVFVNILGDSWPPIGITTVDPAIGDPPVGTA